MPQAQPAAPSTCPPLHSRAASSRSGQVCSSLLCHCLPPRACARHSGEDVGSERVDVHQQRPLAGASERVGAANIRRRLRNPPPQPGRTPHTLAAASAMAADATAAAAPACHLGRGGGIGVCESYARRRRAVAARQSRRHRYACVDAVCSSPPLPPPLPVPAAPTNRIAVRRKQDV